ncbi:MAG: 23S rRNA (adenine(2503)-C(2))-methyltransferase RlmN [Candidatus Omnitrophota bacterium]
MIDLKSCGLKELEIFFEQRKYPVYTAAQIFRWVYKKRIENFDLMANVSKEAKSFLRDNFYFSKLLVIKKEISSDKTEKFLFKLKDEAAIETVFIPEEKRNTLCVSTQVGCKFQCLFCASAALGFKRNLEVSEIIDQFLYACSLVEPAKITNIVFMGIGEPLDNFDNLTTAIKILIDKQGINFSRSKICVSTCGLPSKIKKLAELNLGLKLSVSLHAGDDSTRQRIMPVNKRYPLKELIKAVREFVKLSGNKPVTFEYVLIQGLNTAKEDALKLAKLLKGINAKINLIPYNSFCPEFQAPLSCEVDNFRSELKKRGIFSIIRKPRGQDIHAACGQLRASLKSNTNRAGLL